MIEAHLDGSRAGAAPRDPSDLAAVVEACAMGLLARTRARMEADSRRAEMLREKAELAARLLAGRHGATRVWLFGSLAWGGPHACSDVDLLVEGIHASAWSAALATAEAAVGTGVDLVRVEEAPESLVERAKREGVVLHDAG